MAETILLTLRPTRLIYPQYYLAWILAWVFAVFLFINPVSVSALEWDVPILGIRLKTLLAFLMAFLGLLSVLAAELKRLNIRYSNYKRFGAESTIQYAK